MAAVAADAGAAAVPITITTVATDAESPSERDTAGPGLPLAPPEADGLRESGPGAELVAPRVEDGGDGEERRHVRPELESAAGKAPCEAAGSDEPSGTCPADRGSMGRFSPGLPGDPEGGGNAYRSILPDPQPSAVFLHSFPAPPPATEAGLSLAEPAEPTTNVTTDRADTACRDLGFTTLVQPDLRPAPAEDSMLDGTTGRLSVPVSPDSLDPETGCGKIYAGIEELAARGPREPSPPCRSPKRRLVTDKAASEDPFRAESRADPPLVSVQDLSPGSEVRVCLDHVIDDALVVSFRFGDKVFSGVLMDVSRRYICFICSVVEGSIPGPRVSCQGAFRV